MPRNKSSIEHDPILLVLFFWISVWRWRFPAWWNRNWSRLDTSTLVSWKICTWFGDKTGKRGFGNVFSAGSFIFVLHYSDVVSKLSDTIPCLLPLNFGNLHDYVVDKHSVRSQQTQFFGADSQPTQNWEYLRQFPDTYDDGNEKMINVNCRLCNNHHSYLPTEIFQSDKIFLKSWIQ